MEAEDGFKAHSKAFKESIGSLQTRTLPAASQAALQTLAPLSASYLQQAASIVELSTLDVPQAESMLGALQKTYSQLGGPVSTMGKDISTNSVTQVGAANATILTAAACGALGACGGGSDFVGRGRLAVFADQTPHAPRG
jgi:hypothetical protein